jgi:hypothetical protein
MTNEEIREQAKFETETDQLDLYLWAAKELG